MLSREQREYVVARLKALDSRARYGLFSQDRYAASFASIELVQMLKKFYGEELTAELILEAEVLDAD